MPNPSLPRSAAELGRLAAQAIQSGNPRGALELLDQALLIDPADAVNHCNHGTARERLGQLQPALDSYDRAIAIQPQLPQAHCNRANVLRAMQRWQEALLGYDRAIALKSDYVHAFNNRGKVLAELGEHDKALASYDAAIALKPDFVDGHYNRAVLLERRGRSELALESYDRAIALQPRSSAARFNRALMLLRRGDYTLGWADYEWRWRNDNIPLSRERRNFASPRWSGTEPIAGKTILVYCEQGLGDTIQFCRYVPWLAARGARVIIEVQKPLAGLLRGLEGVTSVVPQGAPLPEFDFHSALMSLPLAFGTTLATVPAKVPYLPAPAEKRAAFRDVLAPDRRFKVGLVWSSGVRPDQPQLRDLDLRNVPLPLLDALSHPEIAFFSLQKGEPASSELARLIAANSLDLRLIDCSHRFEDFADTAGLVSQLDLVISVDTAAAHLAGALGKPLWVLACFNACWRWLEGRCDSPWYPTARLYRQHAPGDWSHAIERVRRDLADLLEARASAPPGGGHKSLTAAPQNP